MAWIRSKKYTGVFRIDGKRGTSYGIDYVNPATGQRVRRVIKGAKSEARAFEARSIEIADAKRGVFNKAYGIQDRRPVLFESMVKLYLTQWSAENKHHYTDACRANVLTGFFHGKLMSDITPFMVEKFKSTQAKRVSKNTVNKYLSLGSQVFIKAKLWNKYSGINPFLEVSRYKIKKGKKPGYLEPGQVAAIMAEIKNDTKRAMVEYAFNTGWRISEMTGLKWDDVDIDNSKAWIVDPKNSNTVEIQLNDRATEIIKNQPRCGDYVFGKKNGDRFRTGISGVFREAAKRAGVYLPPRRAWHILRRTWASMFLQNGGDVETLRQLGNWKDFSMPMWYAGEANTEHKKKILNRIPKLDGKNMSKVMDMKNITG